MAQREPKPSHVQVLQALSAAMTATVNEEAALTALLEVVVRDLGYKAAVLRLVDEERRTLALKGGFGVSMNYLTKGDVAVEQSGVDRAVLDGLPAAVRDVRQDPSFQYPQAAQREGLASLLAVPLMASGRAIGVLHVYTAEPHDFDPDEQALLGVVANLGAQAIRQAQLFAAFRRIAQQVNSSLELKQVLKTLVLEAAHALHVRAASIRLLGPNHRTLHLVATYGLSQAYLEKGPVLLAQSPIDQKVLAARDPVVVSLPDTASGLQYPEAAEREGIRTILMVPLAVFETAVGVLRLYSGQTQRFSAEEMNFAVAVAELGAVAIENAKLHETLKQRLDALRQDADGWYRFLALS